MYFKKAKFVNSGPIKDVQLEFQFHDDGRPKPLVIVGENGSGKTIILSHLANTLLCFKTAIYPSTELDTDRTYRIRSPKYISSGTNFSFAQLELSNNLKLTEWQLPLPKSMMRDFIGDGINLEHWHSIPDHSSSLITFDQSDSNENTKTLIKKQCCLYFPVNRFEEPAWLNYDSLNMKFRHSTRTIIHQKTDRSIIQISPLKDNQNWLMDVILDRELYEKRLLTAVNLPLPVLAGHQGPSTRIYEHTLELLKIITNTKDQDIQFGLGTRRDRCIQLLRDNSIWIPNIFQLSTGETQLLNLSLSIIRDFDLSEVPYNFFEGLKGIVLIDEIDAHLHTSLQTNVLPEIIKKFPSIQFIITTHSPLFLIGLEDALGLDGVQIVEMPTGLPVIASEHREFAEAYKTFMSTSRFRKDIQNELEKQAMPILYVEGDYDILYINRAAELLEKQELLKQFRIEFGDGEGNLTKIWSSFKNPIAEVLPQKLVLLYDCDISKPDAQHGKIYRRTIPQQNTHPLKKGIENLFNQTTIEKVEKDNKHFIDFTPALTTRIHGKDIEAPASYSANKSEKKNLCSWLCNNGSADDFAFFNTIFEILQEIVNDQSSTKN